MTDDYLRPVYIQNIPYEVTEDELAKWCETFGRVAKCRLRYDEFGCFAWLLLLFSFVSPDGKQNAYVRYYFFVYLKNFPLLI